MIADVIKKKGGKENKNRTSREINKLNSVH